MTLRALPAAAPAVLLAGPAAAAGGMPQLDFANSLTVSQAVWMLVIFAVLYLVLGRFALPPVSQVLDRRAAVIRADLDAAKGASEAAKGARAERAKADAKARAEAQAAVLRASEAAKAKAQGAMEAVEARLSADLRAAESRIAAARGAAMQGIGAVAREAAGVAVQRIAGFTPDAASIERAVAERLAARG